ncbi:MAG: diguanylate cyclase [Bdellovibrionales bacterium]|nr:diguanylate cyclase [Bdellovibrionales bacterium]
MSSQPKILCIDDEPGVLQALSRLLKSHFEVLIASNFDEAMSFVEQNSDLSILLSDYRMPGKNGIEFLRSARKLVPFAARAILSGQMDIKDISEAINKAEIHRFLLKPWENDYLVLQCLELLQLHASLVEKGQLHTLSITDPVTQLTNHRYFQGKLREEVTKATNTGVPLSLVMIDVDHFKSFNDKYGHPAGDRVLFEVARQIETQLQTKGVASRYGGEEFAVLLPGVDTFEALQIADRVRKSIEKAPFRGAPGHQTFITVSLGLASVNSHVNSPELLLESADKALYQAKHQGRNKSVVANQ